MGAGDWKDVPHARRSRRSADSHILASPAVQLKGYMHMSTNICVTTNRSQNGCLAFSICILHTLPMTNRILRDDVLQQVLKSATLRRAQCPLQLDCRKCVGMLFSSKMQNIAAPSRRSKSFFCMRNAAIIGTEACPTATGTMSTAA